MPTGKTRKANIKASVASTGKKNRLQASISKKRFAKKTPKKTKNEVKKESPSVVKKTSTRKTSSTKKTGTKKKSIKTAVKKSSQAVKKRSAAKTAKKTSAKVKKSSSVKKKGIPLKISRKSAEKKVKRITVKGKKLSTAKTKKTVTPVKKSVKAKKTKIAARKKPQKKVSTKAKKTFLTKKISSSKKKITAKKVVNRPRTITPKKKTVTYKTVAAKKKTKLDKEFPKTAWGSDSIISFEVTEHLPPPELTSIAGGFVFHNDKVVLANIPGRGWEIIGGRIDVGETPEETFQREAQSQIGVLLSHIKMIGVVRIEHTGPKPPNCPYPYPVGYGIQYIGTVGELLPFTGGPDSLGRSLISSDGLKEHYYEWNEYFESVFKYAYSIYQKWRRKLRL